MTATGWQHRLIADAAATSLVQIGRGQRLALDSKRVLLSPVDEVALALIARARTRRHPLTLVYPAPAGQVAVLLAAEILLERFLQGDRSASLGLVTADPALAARTWEALRIITTGARQPIAEVFPSFRIGPDGHSPAGGRRLTGILIGQQSRGWPVDQLIVDHLAGRVQVADTDRAAVELFADPTDPALGAVERARGLIWAWSSETLIAGTTRPRPSPEARVSTPFSVAGERLDVLGSGIRVGLRVARHPDADRAAARVREDLRLLRSMHPNRSDRNQERGMTAAWHHLTTLTSLPCRPSSFDRHAGLPPMAARPTHSFAPELAAWANTLDPESGEFATILASDLADLRAALERGNPIEDTIREVVRHPPNHRPLIVTRTRTAARALAATLADCGALEVEAVGRLHRSGAYPQVLVIGEPAPWDWHRLLSGLSPQIDVVVLGDQAVPACLKAITSYHEAARRWARPELRARTWSALVGEPPPDFHDHTPGQRTGRS